MNVGTITYKIAENAYKKGVENIGFILYYRIDLEIIVSRWACEFLWVSHMNKLGVFLKKLRKNAGLSIREVEQCIKNDYAQESKYHISHTYLRNLENGEYVSPNPFKLKALCSAYNVSYEKLLCLAGYLDQENTNTEFMDLCSRLFEHLEAEDVNPVYFVQAMLDLGPESLSLVNRTLSMLVVQERAIQKKVVDNAASKATEK